jgi:hypothetical protein
MPFASFSELIVLPAPEGPAREAQLRFRALGLADFYSHALSGLCYGFNRPRLIDKKSRRSKAAGSRRLASLGGERVAL